MVSLSTIYGVSIVLGSLAAIGSAFVGTKVYPIQSGGDPLAGATALAATLTGAFAAAEEAIKPAPEPLATETVKEEPTPAPEQTTISEPLNESVPMDLSSTSEPSPAPIETSALDETIQSVPEEAESEEKKGGRRLPPWFKHTGTKH